MEYQVDLEQIAATLAQLFKDLPALSVADVKSSFAYWTENEIKRVYDEVHGDMKK